MKDAKYYVFTTYQGDMYITANKLYPVERLERDNEGEEVGAYITLDSGMYVLVLIGDKYRCAFLEEGYTWTLTEKH